MCETANLVQLQPDFHTMSAAWCILKIAANAAHHLFCNYSMYAVPKIALDHSSMSSLCKLQPMHSHPNSMISTVMQVLLTDAAVSNGFMEQPELWSLAVGNSWTGLLSLPIYCNWTATSSLTIKIG